MSTRSETLAPTSAPLKVLVLSGGTAHGAYEAGVLEGLAGICYDLVCGTSIGALNGAIFAAGRTAALRTLWHTIAARPVLVPKRPYRRLFDSSAGLFTRLFEGIELALAASTGSLQAIMQSEPVLAILREQLVENGRVRPFRMPLFWAATDLATGCAGYYYRLAPAADDKASTARIASMSEAARAIGIQPLAVPEQVDIILEALRASAAIPGVFDPSRAPAIDGASAGDLLVDGGVINNTPFALVRAATQGQSVEVDAVLLGDPTPARQASQTRNVLEILLACYNVMTQRLMNDAVRALARDDAVARALRATVVQTPLDADAAHPNLGPATRSAIEAALATTLQHDVTIRFRSPSIEPLAGSPFAFDDQRSIDANYDLGLSDIADGQGWMRYAIPLDICRLTGDLGGT